MKILEANQITKIFPGVVALDSVNISFELGKIHCVIGENGAGKSTLIKCLTGVYEPESGNIIINGESALKNKKLFNKIAYVPQEIDLFEYMSVADNLFLPYRQSGLKKFITNKELEKRAIPYLNEFHIKVSPSEQVKNISVSQKQLLQIARATIYEGYDILMLDEPTTSLTLNDIEVLFHTIKNIKNKNKAIVFISHKIEELFSIGDMLTIFRNGKKVAYSEISTVDTAWVITQMTGHVLDQELIYQPKNTSNEVSLEVNNLTGERFSNISFELRKGEILGFSGLIGSGRTELMQAILGYIPIYAGSVKLFGKLMKKGDTSYSVANGLIYLPEERKYQGIFPMLSVRENICVSILKKIKNFWGGISSVKEHEVVEQVIEHYHIKTSSMENHIKFLSGGNQQKVIIGRSMSVEPRVLIFDEPTKGIDVGTKSHIYQIMKNMADINNISIILISSEIEEIVKCSNRIIVLYEGEKMGEFYPNSENKNLISAIIGLN